MKINIKINGKAYECEPNQAVLQIAIDNGIEIPHFCYHEDLPIDAHCRTCLVEIRPGGKVVTSCNLRAEDGLSVLTDSPKVRKLRNENMELMLADHKKICRDCGKGYFCKTYELMKKLGVTGDKYHRAEIHAPLHKMGDAAEFDPRACISCNKCVEMCQKTGICFLRVEGKGAKSHLAYNKDPKIDCIYCGQCTVHCPVAAVREQNQIEEVEKALKDKDKIVIAQMAPSIRVSIGEEFGLPPGTNMEGQMYTALRMLGFDKVFDVNMGADITTQVEAMELIERIKKGGPLPMFTSCCPGWVKFVEFYHPEMIPHLTTSRSPQIHSGGAYKTWWAKKEGINPKKIVVVSFMPCTSKKYEAKFKKLRIKGMYPVDYVLTTRETAELLRRHKINLPDIKPGSVDLYGEYSGAAAIYGASGGVMESALRSAHFFLTGEELKKVEFNAVRGIEYIKEAKIKIGKKTLKVAVCAMAKNASELIRRLKKNPKLYDYIEVMSCPGGCIGGGGQPMPSTERIVQERIKALYTIDDKMKMRSAHANPVVRDFFDNYIAGISKRKASKILYTKYKRKRKFE
jgi:NADP-reducing hydrogenase subunit HndD